MTETRIRIFYPADPLGVVPGGVDTFLRGLIKWAPQDIAFSLVGMTTDVAARPLGRWTRCRAGSREFDMHPVCAVRDAGTRGLVPLSVRFMSGVNRDRLALSAGFDVFDFHRIEPALMWAQDLRPKNVFFHQDPTFVRLSASDNLWRHMPAVYERLERSAMQRVGSAWCVRDSGVATLRDRYPELAPRIRFVPTWVDSDVFHPLPLAQRDAQRDAMARRYGLDPQDAWLVSVGRLDTQKDPLLMVAALAQLRRQGRRVRWLVIGDGVLRGDMQRCIEEAGIGDAVRFLGLQPPARIAEILGASDGYVLSSAYEGMPMALLEALGCGLPVAATDVGEVRRVVRDGVNGRVVTAGDAGAFAAALGDLLDHLPAWRGAPALDAVQPFQPGRVLGPVYDSYRESGEPVARLRKVSRTAARLAGDARRLEPVVGVPVDVLQPELAVARVLGWAAQRESRYVCFVNVHSAIQANVDERHRVVLGAADMAVPDGAPIAWTLRAKGHAGQARVDGPGTMWHLLDEAQRRGVRVGFYGSDEATLRQLTGAVTQAFAGLRVAYAHSPPFRDLTPEEDDRVCREITDSGVELLFVGLGCPKQEFWMAAHRGRLACVMLGVGAAFEFHAGMAARAPRWMRDHGLEWLHRLAVRPGRLWRRYAYSNSLFVGKSMAEALRSMSGWLRARPSTPER
jgi:exopolysaccharide biosynthesis WecB/TagA/CpsF family protein